MPNIKLITENLADELIPAIERATSIYIMTSFVMASGVQILAPHLRKAAQYGTEIKVLGGDYLFVTQPDALRKLLQIDPRIEARLWRSRGASFHPKAYLLDFEENEGLLIVGSSNLSRSAFKLGIEWNLAMNAQAEPTTFQDALDKFMHNFHHEWTVPLNELTIAEYEKEYEIHKQRNPELERLVIELDELELHTSAPVAITEPIIEETITFLEPRPAQQLALEALAATVEEDYNKAMVVMATGLGKTYLAAFFAKSYKRVLFVAHREEILQQASASFHRVLPDRSVGLYNGQEKNVTADCVFASIYTLGMKKHRERFNSDAFDLIIVDEFHHAAARSYQSVLEYFQPEFMLGITATPDRMDGKDVYGLCDGNVAYQLHFLDAIQQQWLSPFRYFGVYDETDYSAIPWVGSGYDEEELLAAQLKDDMAEKIYQAWTQHKQTRTIGFCSSIRQANFLAQFFKGKGVKALALHSNTREMSRVQAIQGIQDLTLELIFTVDLFNEGVDIPSVDTLLFTRPTESLTVFTQQVGRGLRLHGGKSHCSIIDLIGNYRYADLKMSLFQIAEESTERNNKSAVPSTVASCEINLELRVINLLEELFRKRQPRKDNLKFSYFKLKSELGRRPTYLELHLHGHANSREYVQEFKSYLGFLHWAGELDEHEVEVYLQHQDWIREVEGTVMTKSYKMVVLAAMLERGPDHWADAITPEEVAPYFHRFYMEKDYRKKIDFSDAETKKLWDYDEAKVAKLIARMPMTKWSGSSKGLVSFEGGRFEFNIPNNIDSSELIYVWVEQICKYRLHWHFERKVNNTLFINTKGK
ncbi:DNA helicase [Paenibacillus swuensis]|uniref:DNA helicase n=1 Tax=Paenibacillus swuensis TaxID=1178515 RepID=A0A172TEB5_9BACL|nr:DEAD/DEAH box helicase family protein [Paenibacillus swuensis]ANE45254.1 DNA helicase [Paenibacillus swuensis]